MKMEISIPKSAATKNLIVCAWISTIALVLAIFNVPMYVILPIAGIAGGFLFSAIACILDIQEFKMKQNQRIIELLEKKNA